MIPPRTPPDEKHRLDSLRSLNLLDTPAEERFDRVTRLARRLFDVPIALVSLVDEDRQWFKSRQGLDASETPREVSFCGHAILGPETLVVSDATRDERFHDNPLVTGAPEIRFYAGRPLAAPDGQRVGTLCLIDTRAREFGTDDAATLDDLAHTVERELAAFQVATLDPLTGLTNRRGFEGLAHHTLALCARMERPATLLFLDLDGFKAINDELGHAAGDRALCELADCLLQVFRQSDVIARTGGDEFCVLLSGAGEKNVGRPLAALAEAVRALNETRPPSHPIAYSVGYACVDPVCPRSLAQLVEEADTRMYEAKRARRSS